MLRKAFLGVAAAVTLSGGVIAGAPASAQVVTLGLSAVGQADHGYQQVQYGYGPGWGPRPYYGRPYYGGPRPYYGYGRPYYGPRCYFRPVRYWDGWSWVVQQQRICR